MADDCVAIVRDSTSANLRWANNTLTTNGVMHGVHVSIVSFVKQAGGVSVGSVSGSATTQAEVDELVRGADAAARAAAPAEDAQELVADRTSPDWADEPASTGIEVYDDVAPALGEAFGRAGAAGRVLYGFVNHEMATTYLGSTTGLRLRHVQPTGHFACTGKTADLTNSAWVGRATRDFTDVDPLAAEEELAQRLAWGKRRVDLEAGRYDTILPPTAVADLMIYAYWLAGARNAWDGQSVFSRPAPAPGSASRCPARGDALLRPGVRRTAVRAVRHRRGVLQRELGLRQRPRARPDRLDPHGELAALRQTRHTAEMTKQPVTPAIDNLVLEVDGGAGSVEDLVAGTERGLLLTCMWYIRVVDPQTALLTGLTRDGVYLVENGEITAAVNNFRWNESPVDLLRRFSHASATVPSFSREWGDDYFSRTATPALRVPDFNMSSVSPAQ